MIARSGEEARDAVQRFLRVELPAAMIRSALAKAMKVAYRPLPGRECAKLASLP